MDNILWIMWPSMPTIRGDMINLLIQVLKLGFIIFRWKTFGNAKTTKNPRFLGGRSVPTCAHPQKKQQQKASTKNHLEAEYGDGLWSGLTQLNQWYSVPSNPFKSGFNSLDWRWRWFKSLLPMIEHGLLEEIRDLGVSKNRGTPKWMVYNGKPY